MLVLTRKKNQQIMLDESIKITILEVADDTVKIGIDAPREINVLRGELYLAVKEENTKAVNNETDSAELLKKMFGR